MSTTKWWWDGRLAGFDLETTSPDPETARVVTSAVVVVGDAEPMESFTQLINPGVDIPDEAAAIHGVTNERAQAEGAEASLAIGELLDVLLALIEVGIPLAIFNARFDLTVLDREARRWDMEPISSHPKLRVIDPRVLDGFLERFRPGKRTLGATAEYWLPQGKTLGDAAHDADADAITAVRLGYRMVKHGQVIRRARDRDEEAELARMAAQWESVRYDLDALHFAQIGWAEFQARGLEEHFQRTGKPKLVDYVWPVILPGQRREGTEGARRGLPANRGVGEVSSDAAYPAPKSAGLQVDSVVFDEAVDIEAEKAKLFDANPRQLD